MGRSISRSAATKAMSKVYARPLLDQEAIENFLDNCLSIKDPLHMPSGKSLSAADIAKKIRDAESAVRQTDGEPTYSSKRNRVKEYREKDARQNLREQILTELITLDRLDNDDEIQLNKGGAKPQKRDPTPESKAFFVIGLPASGKSTLVNTISDKLGAIILDSDFAKRKLPEFDNTVAGANIVHREASEIVFGGQEAGPSLFGYCKAKKLNVVIPKIGQDFVDLRKFRDALNEAGYKVHLTATILTREIATARALNRFLETGRYVPLGLIFDGYGNDPLLNYYKERVAEITGQDKGWGSFGAISTHNEPVTVEDCTSEENPAHLLKT